ncbi:protein ALTERED XYLOGLUCAN 9-like [Wolffia australiana]
MTATFDSSLFSSPALPHTLSPSLSCDNRKRSGDLLYGTRILVTGDSQARLFALALLGLVLKPSALEAAMDQAAGTRLDFVWAPYEVNLTGQGWGGTDMVVMGSGLWHMLHVGEVGEYRRGLAAVGVVMKAVKGGRLLWLGLARVRAARGSELLREEGGPFVLVDMGGLTAGCGEGCAKDGVHYVEGAYEDVVQVVLHLLAADGFSPRH